MSLFWNCLKYLFVTQGINFFTKFVRSDLLDHSVSSFFPVIMSQSIKAATSAPILVNDFHNALPAPSDPPRGPRKAISVSLSSSKSYAIFSLSPIPESRSWRESFWWWESSSKRKVGSVVRLATKESVKLLRFPWYMYLQIKETNAVQTETE